jgi:homoserine O-acetyltransferase/O-succinyltransferase
MTRSSRVILPWSGLPSPQEAPFDEVEMDVNWYGDPDRGEGVVAVIHDLFHSHHAAGPNGWWEDMIGPGRAIDTDRWAVACINHFGGTHGSTGPGSIDPSTGARLGSRFPKLSVTDLASAQLAALDALGVGRLRAVIGAGFGGMVALSMATLAPDRIDLVIPIATGIRATRVQIMDAFHQTYAVTCDPAYLGGDFDRGSPPIDGLALAFMLASTRATAGDDLDEGPAPADLDGPAGLTALHPFESKAYWRARRFAETFDATSMVTLLDAWRSFDLAATAADGDLGGAFARCRQQTYLILGIDSDTRFYPKQQAALAAALKAAGIPMRRITVSSDLGHEAWIREPHLFAPLIRDALDHAARR